MMKPLPAHRRALISRKDLLGQIAGIKARLDDVKRRAALLDLMRRAIADGRREVERRFEETGNGRLAARDLCYLFDQIIRVLFDDAVTTVYPTPNPTAAERLSVIAVGGFGRGQLAPFSDLDILFIRPWKSTPRAEQVVEYMLYLLWDLGLKVGHATRTVDETLRAARDDITIRTALLEGRWLWGDQDLWLELKRRFAAEIVAGSAPAFVEAKLAERDARHLRMGDSRYVLEPNIKEGKGGLRDLHTLMWIARYAYGVTDSAGLTLRGVLTGPEAARFTKADGFLWDLRWHLHLAAGRAEERLVFDLQSQLADRMGYTDHAGARGVERFMKHYFLVAKDIGDLSRILCAALESEQRKTPRLSLTRLLTGWKRDFAGFRIEADRLTIRSPERIAEDPILLLRLFWVAHKHNIEIHPRTLRLVSQNLKGIDRAVREDPRANELFLDILTGKTDPEGILRRMNEVGLFGRFVPDFGRVVAQMQYDMYHVFTVDEHTLFAIGILHRIESGKLTEELPLASALMPKLQSRRALYVAILLHDIAKGRGGDHSELGEKVAYRLGPRFGLTAEETETVAWLVRWHLLMSNTAFKRDLQDAQTIQDFVALVQSPERLKLLLVLTVADIRAVGPKVWNNWKAGLLRDLYMRAEDAMTGALSAESLLAAAATGSEPPVSRRRLEAALADMRSLLPDWTDAQVESVAEKLPPAYLVSTEAAAVARQARLIRRATDDNAPLAVETRVDPRRAVTEVSILAPDELGLFSQLAGALAMAGASIVDAKICTLTDGMALDSFLIQNAEGRAFDRPERLAKLAVLIEQSVHGRLTKLDELGQRRTGPSRAHVFRVSPRVLVDSEASATHTLIEVNGRDRPGLLFDLTSSLTALKLQIGSAKVSTFGERVVDVFYVKDLFGLKIEKENRINEIRAALLKVLAETPTETAAVPRPRRVRRRLAA